jgi:hypothetical protein
MNISRAAEHASTSPLSIPVKADMLEDTGLSPDLEDLP